MSGFDDDFLSGPAPAPAPTPSAKGAAASPSPPAPADDFEAFVSAPTSTEPSSGFLSPEAADAAKAMKARSGAAVVAVMHSAQAGKRRLTAAVAQLMTSSHSGLAAGAAPAPTASAAQASTGARRLRTAVGRVTPRQWAAGLGVLALAIGLSFGVRWWMHRPATPAVAAAKAEAPVAPAASIAAVAVTVASQKPVAPVTAATLPAAPTIAPTTPPPAVEHHAPRPAPKREPWKVAHAADIHKSMQQHTEKTDDAWAKEQSARLDAFFKKKH